VNSDSSDFLGSASEKATDQFVIEPREKATDSTAQSAEQPQEPAEPAEPSVSRKEETTARIPTDVIQVTSSGGPSEYANHVSRSGIFLPSSPRG